MAWTKQQGLSSISRNIRQLMVLSDLQGNNCIQKAVDSFTEHIQCGPASENSDAVAILRLISTLIEGSQVSSSSADDVLLKCCLPVLSDCPALESPLFSACMQCLTVTLNLCSYDAQSAFLFVHLKLIEKYADDASVTYGGASHHNGEMSIECLMSVLNIIVTRGLPHCDAYMKLIDYCTELIDHVSDDIAGKLVGSLIPKTLNALEDQYQKIQLQSLWIAISKLYEEDCNERLFLFLCGLADFYFPASDSSEPLVNLVDQNILWDILQSGLFHLSSMTRKIALYLLKRILDISEIQNKEVPRCQSEKNKEKRLFWWIPKQKRQLSSVWQDFILLMETLEEKQVHVIKPILPRFSGLVEATAVNENGSLLHTSWITCIIRRTAVHESLYLKRWGTAAMLSINLDHCPLLDQGGLKFLEGPFVEIITESSLYHRLPEMKWDECPAVVDLLITFLKKLFSKLSPDNGSLLFEKLFERLCADTWDSASVMYIMKAFSSLPRLPLWRKHIVGYIRELLNSCIRTMDTYIRGALQSYLLRALVNLLDWNSVTLEDFATLLSYLTSSESIRRGSPSWSNVTRFLNSATSGGEAISAAQVQEYCTQTTMSILKQPEADNLKTVPVMRFLLIATDADLLRLEDRSSSAGLRMCLKPVFDVITSVNTNAYMTQVKIDAAFLMVATVLSEANSISEFGNEEDAVNVVLKELLKTCRSDIFLYVERQLKENISEIKDLERLSLLFEVIDGMMLVVGNDVMADATFHNLAQVCIDILEQSNQSRDDLKLKKVGAMVVLSILYTKSHSNGLGEDSIMESFFTKWIPQKVVKPKEDKKNSLDKTWGLKMEEYMAAQWNAIGKCFSAQSSIASGTCEEYTKMALDMLDVVSASAVITILKVLAVFVPQVSEDTYREVVDVCWRKIQEFTKTSFFWPAFEEFINVSITSKSLAYTNGKLQEIVAKIFDMAEEKQGLVIILINRLCDLYENITEEDYRLQVMADMFIRAVGYGTMHGRGKRFLLDVKVYLNTEKDLSVNYLLDGTRNMDRLVQAKIFTMLATLTSKKSKDVQFGKMMVTGIKTNLVEKMRMKSYRNYSNTQCHREKHRNIVAMAMLMQLLEHDKEFRNDFHDLLMEVLVAEDQPSVRCYAEIFLTKLCLQDPSLLQKLQKEFDYLNEKRTTCYCSLMVVITHVAKLLRDLSSLEDFILGMLPKLLPLCLVYPVNLRTFGQVTILQLWEVAKEKNLTKVLDTHSIIESFNIFHTAAGHQHACRTTLHLMENFIMHIDLVEDWNMDTLTAQLPRLTQLVDDEWISTEMFEKIDPQWRTDPEKFSVALRGSRNVLANRTPGTWRIKNPASGEEEGGEGDVQKKIQPWRTMLPSEDSEVQEDYVRKRQNAGQLVLVTSLIDKPANLGGLCRTSEIFGVSEFVIGKMKYVTDKSFESLCVTANKWVPMVEVRPHDLKDYLLVMKQEGYTLVGAEQTANSKSLLDYKFPVKTLLLLGNEKEGIPANLLQLLDVCVEIPQAGMIRSLNVHVSGALLIWSYAQQHLFTDSLP